MKGMVWRYIGDGKSFTDIVSDIVTWTSQGDHKTG